MGELKPGLPFADAFAIWLNTQQFPSPDGRARYVSARTLRDYEQYANALHHYFIGRTLDNILLAHLQQYQASRSFGFLVDHKGNGIPSAVTWQERCGPNRINQELSILVRVMRAAGAWTADLEQKFRPLLRIESDVPRALTPEEQQKWLKTCAGDERFHVVLWYSVLGIQSVASTNELRKLRLEDFSLTQRVLMVRVRSSKNKYRTRTIPLSDLALWALTNLRDRAVAAGCVELQHYLFPLRLAPGVYAPGQPMHEAAGFRKLWDEVRQKSGITWFRQYDMRHTGLTRMAEAGEPIYTLMEFAGHISEKMRRHYTHISEQAKRKAVERVWGKKESNSATPNFLDMLRA